MNDPLLEQTLAAAANGDFAHYRPESVIEAANALLPLGKERALAALDSYLAGRDLQADPQEGLYLLLRVLIEIPTPPGYHPPLMLGGTSPPPPPSPESLPHFPLVLIDDRPLLLVTGFALGGDVKPVTTQIEHYRATGALRSRPLTPYQAPDIVLDEFRAIYQSAYGVPPAAHETDWIATQLRGTQGAL